VTVPRVTALVPGNNEGTIGPSHYYRLTGPMDWLRRYHDWPTQCMYLGGIMSDTAMRQVMKEADILVTWRASFTTPQEFKAFAEDLHRQGKKFVLDMDDLPNQFNTGALATLRGADLITCTTEPLAQELRAYNRTVVVLPNSIDVHLWPETHVSHDPPVIGLMGSPSHHKDWHQVMDFWPVIHARYPEVELQVIGACPPYLERDELNIKHLGWQDREKMPELLSQWDIGLAPLQATRMNRSKSNLHWLEYSMAGVASILSPTMYEETVEHGSNALIARTVTEWIDHISDLIEDTGQRQTLARTARRDVLTYYDALVTSELWATTYKELIK